MEHLAQLLQEHFRNHPGMELRDAIKFLYQSSMGGGHLIADPSGALARLEEEWEQTGSDPASPPTEPLGGGLCRLSLAACKGLGSPPPPFSPCSFGGRRSASGSRSCWTGAWNFCTVFPFPQRRSSQPSISTAPPACRWWGTARLTVKPSPPPTG